MTLRMFGFLKMSAVFLQVILLPIILFPSYSWGQEYPTKPIQLVVPFPPGGAGPVLAMLVAEEVKKYLPQPVIVAHKPGAAGSIGSYSVAKSPPDGYTLLLGATYITNLPLLQKVDYTVNDFELMGQIVTTPFNIAVKADAPWKNLKELISYAKKNPEIVTYGTMGTHSPGHLRIMIFERIAGIKLTHVPFKGSADAMSALAGGHVGFCTRYPAEGEALVDAGKVRVLSVFDSKRCKYYPNVPTAREEGYDIVSFSWRNISAPKGTPKAIQNTWDNIIKKITQDNSFVEKCDKLKLIVEFKSADDLKKYVAKEMDEIGELIKKLGIAPK
jgi:tripartite-type tricarboxylate transporter receptor subunit TctC